MYLMYVDESGDCGTSNSPTSCFVLTGIVIHELAWHDTLRRLIDFRKQMKAQFNLGMRDELHAAQFLTSPGKHVHLKKNVRLQILRLFADQLASMDDLNVINVVVDKKNRATADDVFEFAWRVLIQRFENTMAHGNFSGPSGSADLGMLFPDRTDDKKLIRQLRRMRHYNPIPSRTGMPVSYRNLRIAKIVEDPNFRDSEHSLFVQAVDLAAFLLYQHECPNAYMRKKGGRNFFLRLEPVLCKHASRSDPYGVVRI